MTRKLRQNTCKILTVLSLLSISMLSNAQNKAADASLQRFIGDELLQGASVSVSVARLPDKEEMFGYDSNRQLVPASVQKAIVTVTALEAMGSAFTFDHSLKASGSQVGATLKGDLLLETSGDPSFAAARFSRKQGDPIAQMIQALQRKGINEVEGNFIVQDDYFTGNSVAASTAWGDVGNYFAAGAPSFSYRENYYSLHLNSMDAEQVKVTKTDPELPGVSITCEVKGTDIKRDDAWIYSTPGSDKIHVQGEIPKGKEDFVIKGSIPDPVGLFHSELRKALAEAGIKIAGVGRTSETEVNKTKFAKEIWKGHSPSIKQICIMTNRYSINTYADALFKHIGLALSGEGSFEAGESAMHAFWKERGVNVEGWNMVDGSGLSRLNHVSARQLSLIIAKLKPSNKVIFLEGLKPFGYDELMKRQTKAKSGTIQGVKAFTGYYTAADGTEYTFAVIVNHHQGMSSRIKARIEILLKEVLESLDD